MRTVSFGKIGEVLCIGAHSDDLEIGCGGTVLKLIEENPSAAFHWVVLGARGERRGEAEVSANRLLHGAGESSVEIHKFRDGFFPYDGAKVKSFFEDLKGRVAPDLIFTHYRHDLHQDHRLASELTWNTFRSHLIFEYEVPKWDGDMGAPNFFVHLSPSQCETKARLLRECFPSQTEKHWFTDELFLGLMRIRGMESNSPSNYAEAFYARKVCW